MNSNNYNSFSDDIDFLDVVPRGKKGIKRFDVYAKYRRRRFIGFTMLILFAIGITFVLKYNISQAYELNMEKIEKQATTCMQTMYLNLNPLFDMKECDEIINEIKDTNNKYLAYTLAHNYLEILQNYYDSTNFESDFLQELDGIKENSNLIDKYYQTKLLSAINNSRTIYNSFQSNYSNIINVINNLNNEKITYNEAEEKVKELLIEYNKLPDSNRKKNIYEYYELANELITNNRNEYTKKKDNISSAWVILSIPYTSQNDNKILNGCEIACLLMSLQYKGYCLNKTLKDFADLVPKSDNPEEGFYLDIYGQEPFNKAHWIAPEPLKKFGISQSGKNNIINSTSWDLEKLDEEVINGNPVIIYLTSAFETPRNFSNGVPNNLHVLLLAGYNKETKEQLIIDPWNYHSASSYWILSYDKVNNIYEKVGKRSLVVQ